MFSCQKCDTVLTLSGTGAPPAATKPLAEPPAVRMGRDPRKGTERREARERSALPDPDFSYSRFAKVAADRDARASETPREADDASGPEAPAAPQEPPPPPEPAAPPPAPPKEAREEIPPPEPGPSDAPAPPPKKASALTPFPPTPPEKLPGGAKEAKTEGAAKKPKKKAKKGVRLIVRCTVCGTRHDAAGKSPGDTIRCVCGKKIRITAPKKKAKNPKKKKSPSGRAKDAEDVLDKKALRSEDVDILEL
jgi:hypothetical protein